MAKSDLQVEIFVICDLGLISRENKLSIIGIFDQIASETIPFNYSKMTLVAVISGIAQSEHALQLEIKDPANKTISKIDLKVVLGVGGKSNILTELANFPVTQAGVHKVTLSENKQLLAVRELSVGKAAHQSSLPN